MACCAGVDSSNNMGDSLSWCAYTRAAVGAPEKCGVMPVGVSCTPKYVGLKIFRPEMVCLSRLGVMTFR